MKYDSYQCDLCKQNIYNPLLFDLREKKLRPTDDCIAGTRVICRLCVEIMENWRLITVLGQDKEPGCRDWE